MPLDPRRLTTHASLNRVSISALPGVELGPELAGRAGGELLSQRAAADLVRSRAPALGLGHLMAGPDAALLQALEALVAGPETRARGVAETIAAQLGRRLAVLLAVLRRGDAPNRAARPEWDDSYWAHWADVRRVWLGGGIAAGALGTRLASVAAAELPRLGVTGMEVRIAPWGSVLPLVGAARRLPRAASAGLVCDFGHTSLKLADAQLESGALVSLSTLSRRPIPFSTELPPEGAERDAVARAVLSFMVAQIAEAWAGGSARSVALGEAISVSIASYVDEGANHPLDQSGLYATVGTLARPLGVQLGSALTTILGRQIRVSLAHDGTSAARALAGERDAAVIMLGTSIGVGFPAPTRAGLRPLADGFRVGPGPGDEQKVTAVDL